VQQLDEERLWAAYERGEPLRQSIPDVLQPRVTA
jgi:hypothetical protein